MYGDQKFSGILYEKCFFQILEIHIRSPYVLPISLVSGLFGNIVLMNRYF